MIPTSRFFLVCCLVGACTATPFEALSNTFLVSGLTTRLQGAFPGEPELAVRKAVADGLVRALGDEGLNLQDVVCNRDYSTLCPEGWGDSGDGSTCIAPANYQGPCGPKLELGGLAAEQKRLEAARCDASYSCLGACTADLSAACPLGWHEDVNSDCLAPVGYSGQCVMRKSFRGMKMSERHLWCKSCDVNWPCRKTVEEAAPSEKVGAAGAIHSDCIPDYSNACPERFTEEGHSCIAPVGFSGRCGFSLSSKYSPEEKAAYAMACATPWRVCVKTTGCTVTAGGSAPLVLAGLAPAGDAATSFRP